ncbi:MAG: hypothetical protein L6Q71_01355 [Planctomycetes bacterium]|nr:hypothetical protein [Planctomycetota bacterium]
MSNATLYAIVGASAGVMVTILGAPVLVILLGSGLGALVGAILDSSKGSPK